MADDIDIKDAANTTVAVATRDKGGREVQLVQLDLGNGSTVSPVEGTVPVSGTVAISNLPATQPVSANALPLPTGAATAAAQATATATLAEILAAVSATLAVGGTVSISNLPATQPVSGTVAISNFPGTQPVSGPLTDAQLRAADVPVSGTFWQATQPISAAALPLPAGAASETTLATLLSATAFQSRVPVLGQALMAASMPVVIASNQGNIPIVENATVYTGAAAQTAAVNNILESVSGSGGTASENFRAATVQVVSTGTAGTFIFEQSNDNVNWAALPVFNAALVTAVPITAAITATATAIVYSFPVRARFTRLRIVTPITGGSIQAFSRFSTEPWTPAAFLVASNTAANCQVTATLSANTPTLAAGTNRAAFLAGAAIWFDDSSTNLASNATFTGTSRDLTVTATATAMANAATYAQELVLSAESDVTGTLWLEVSRDNTNWRRIKSLATSAVTGGGFYAEIVHRPSWRYARVGFTNGAGAQARFTINSILKAI